MVWFWRVVGIHRAWVSEWLPGTVISGIGAGLVLPALGAAAIAATPGRGYAMSGALNTTARQLGAALGIAIVIVLIGGVPTSTTLRHGWIFSGACFVVVVLLGMLIGRLRPAAEIPSEDAGARPIRCTTSWRRARQSSRAISRPHPAMTSPGSCGRSDLRRATAGSAAAHRADRRGRQARRRRYLFRRGDPVDGMYVLRAGRVGVLFEDSGAVARRELGRGEVLGGLALLAEPRRSATVQATRDSELIRIPRAEFEQLMRAGPELALALNTRLAGLCSAPASTSGPPGRCRRRSPSSVPLAT